jgi:tripartite-type tricarboxylate transporter receptor subunit TctC
MLKFQRRQFLSLAAGAAAMPTVSRMATAQTYPTWPVRIVVGFTVGGFYDTYARLIAQWLSEHLGQPFVIENRIGAGGSIATEAVVRAAPDGYTLLFTGSNDAWNTALYDNLSFNYVRDITPVASISKGMGVLVVPPSFPARTVHEFITYARDNPAKVTIASDGVGSGPHVFLELFRSMTGLNTLHVPYRGAAPVIIDLLGAQVQAYFGYVAPLIEYIRRDQLRPLAVTSAIRAEALPGVPTIAEFVPGYDATGWNGIGAPRRTPVEVVEKLNNEINAALANSNVERRIVGFGDTVFASSPADFGRHIIEFTEKWSKVIRAANISQPAMPMVGLIDFGRNAAGANITAFQRGLAEVGFIEGRDVTIEHRPIAEEVRLPEVAADLVRRRVAVIVAPGSTPAALAAKAATAAIPVVFGVADDPVQTGLVVSLNRPGGNVTGFTEVNTEVWSKRLEILRVLVPTAERFGVLFNPNNPLTQFGITEARAAAATSHRSIEPVSARSDNEIESAFASLLNSHIDALLVTPDPLFMSRRVDVVALAARYSLPAAYWIVYLPRTGGSLATDQE